MEFPCKVGIAMPEDIKECYETEPREYLVGIKTGGISGLVRPLKCDSLNRGYQLKAIIHAGVDIVGYVDVTTGAQVPSRGELSFFANYPCSACYELSQEEADKQQAEYDYVKSLFRGNRIYRIKGLAPVSCPDRKPFNNEYHMQCLYILEILSDNEENEYLRNSLDVWFNPVTLQSEELGNLILDKNLMWYFVEKTWRRQPFTLNLKIENENEDATQGLAFLEQFWKKKAAWDKKLRAFAAKQLLTLANEWASSDDKDPDKVWTEETFAQKLKNESLVMDNEGNFEMWFDDGGIFFGHSVTVSGNINTGAREAQMT